MPIITVFYTSNFQVFNRSKSVVPSAAPTPICHNSADKDRQETLTLTPAVADEKYFNHYIFPPEMPRFALFYALF